MVRYFRNLCDRNPPNRKFQKLQILQNSLKYLTFTFGERTFTFGERTFTFGNERLLLGNERLLLEIIGVFGFLGEFLYFVAGGFWDSMGRGARRGFRNYLTC